MYNFLKNVCISVAMKFYRMPQSLFFSSDNQWHIDAAAFVAGGHLTLATGQSTVHVGCRDVVDGVRNSSDGTPT